MDEVRQIEKYVDVDKLNAISNYLYGINYNEKEHSNFHEKGILILGKEERKEILEVYMVMDKNDIQHYLAKKIEENGDKLCNSLSEFEELIKRIKGI